MDAERAALVKHSGSLWEGGVNIVRRVSKKRGCAQALVGQGDARFMKQGRLIF